MLLPVSESFCSRLNSRSQEPMYGSAAQVEHLFLLEYDAPFGRKALEESRLPAAVVAHLQAQVKTVAHGKLLLIKNDQHQLNGPRLWCCVLSETNPFRYPVWLTRYEDLLDIHFDALVQMQERSVQPLTEPMYIVCTNGKRDQCCSKFGLPIYKALKEKLPPHQVWEGSHFGGHRFAPTLIALPTGICYGHLTVEAMDELVAQTAEGKLLLPYLRGRMRYPAAVQAADYYLRNHLQNSLVVNQVWVQHTKANHLHTVHFNVANHKSYQVVLEERTSEEEVYDFAPPSPPHLILCMCC